MVAILFLDIGYQKIEKSTTFYTYNFPKWVVVVFSWMIFS